MKTLSKVLDIIDTTLRFVTVPLSIVLFFLAFAEVFGKQLCENDSTCYAVIAFIGGIIITLKIKVLDTKNGIYELVFFILGVIVNVLFLVVAYNFGCQKDSEEAAKYALLFLNATIWFDFIVMMRNLYIVGVIYGKEIYANWSNKREKNKKPKTDLFEHWLNREAKSKIIKRALTDRSYRKIDPSLKNEEINCSLATYGDSIIKYCLSHLLLDKVEKISEEKKKYESDEFLVKVVAKRYDLLKFIHKDTNDIKMPNDYNYVKKTGSNPHKYIATAVEAVIGAIYKETDDLKAITKIIDSWRTIK